MMMAAMKVGKMTFGTMMTTDDEMTYLMMVRMRRSVRMS